jgi:hypothetical protein
MRLLAAPAGRMPIACWQGSYLLMFSTKFSKKLSPKNHI